LVVLVLVLVVLVLVLVLVVLVLVLVVVRGRQENVDVGFGVGRLGVGGLGSLRGRLRNRRGVGGRLGFGARERDGATVASGCRLVPGTLSSPDRYRRSGALERLDQVRLLTVVGQTVLQLGERRQVLEPLQAEVIEELPRRAEHLGLARHIAVADDAHPSPLLQRTDDVRTHGDAAHLLDLAPRDRLSVS